MHVLCHKYLFEEHTLFNHDAVVFPSEGFAWIYEPSEGGRKNHNSLSL
jgi:hypothetical protein